MTIILSTIIALIIILLFSSFAAWLDGKDKDKFIEKTVDNVSALINSKISLVTDQREAGPWYLVVYTQDSNYPIWISNNNIRSVYPDPQNSKIIVKQFNCEDMVIENVINYDMRAANKLFDYEM